MNDQFFARYSIHCKKVARTTLCVGRVAICLGLMVTAVVFAFFFFPANLYYHVTEVFSFTSADEETSVFLGVLVPQSGPYQWVGNLNILWEGAQQTEMHDHVNALKLSTDMSADEYSEAIIEYDVKLRQGKISWESALKAFHLLPQSGIESDHYLIRDQAADLRSAASSNDVYRIYSFTSEHLSYSQMQEDCISSSALKSYEIGSCVCAGYARLMVALSRASNIPAQMVIGFLYPDPFVKRGQKGTLENPGLAHAWVEYNTFGKWQMADPTMGSGIWKRMYFGRNDGRHIVYGEIEQLSQIVEDQKYWARKSANFPLGDQDCFRYTATSNSDGISISPLAQIKKGWDGRWVNAVVVWMLATFLLCKYREKLISPTISTK